MRENPKTTDFQLELMMKTLTLLPRKVLGTKAKLEKFHDVILVIARQSQILTTPSRRSESPSSGPETPDQLSKFQRQAGLLQFDIHRR